jgi:hypothetical protein
VSDYTADSVEHNFIRDEMLASARTGQVSMAVDTLLESLPIKPHTPISKPAIEGRVPAEEH